MIFLLTNMIISPISGCNLSIYNNVNFVETILDADLWVLHSSLQSTYRATLIMTCLATFSDIFAKIHSNYNVLYDMRVL